MGRRRAGEVYQEILNYKSKLGCSCPFDESSSAEALVALGAGCTDPHKRAEWNGTVGLLSQMELLSRPAGFVCPVLSKYRRLRTSSGDKDDE